MSGEINWAALQEPFDVEDITWKIQTSKQNKETSVWRHMAVPYGNLRKYIEILNTVLGVDGWGDKTTVYLSEKLVMTITDLTIGNVTKSGDGSAPLSAADGSFAPPITIATAQSFKRACVKVGLGAILYQFPRCYIESEKKLSFLPASDRRWLDKVYVAWVGAGCPDDFIANSVSREVSREEAETLKVTFGKYKPGGNANLEGPVMTLSQVFAKDKGYVQWLSNNANSPYMRSAAKLLISGPAKPPQSSVPNGTKAEEPATAQNIWQRRDNTPVLSLEQLDTAEVGLLRAEVVRLIAKLQPNMPVTQANIDAVLQRQNKPKLQELSSEVMREIIEKVWDHFSAAEIAAAPPPKAEPEPTPPPPEEEDGFWDEEPPF